MASRATWHRRALAFAVAGALHGGLFLVIVGDLNARRIEPAPPAAEPISVTLLRLSPHSGAKLQRASPRAHVPLAAPPTMAAPAPPVASAPVPAGDAPSPAPASVATARPPAKLELGCVGRSLDRMTVAERRACEKAQFGSRSGPPGHPLAALPETEDELEFRTALAERQANHGPMIKAGPGNDTWVLYSSRGDGLLNKYFTPAPPPKPHPVTQPPDMAGVPTPMK